MPVHGFGDRILTSVPEAYYTVGAKTKAAFRHALETYDFDYVYRTNTSSYLNTELLAKRLDSLPQKGVYSGYPGRFHSIEFASGTSILLSRDVVEYFVEAKAWQHELTDDVAMGALATRLGLKLRPSERVDVTTPAEVDTIPIDDLRNVELFRCKSLTDRSQDASIMRRLSQRLHCSA